MTLTYCVLGTLQVRRFGVPLAVPSGKAKAVLAHLLLRAGRTVLLEELIDEVWESAPPASATANLRTYIANLRRLLNRAGSATIYARAGGYQLAVEPGQLDSVVFHDLVNSARAALGVGDRRRATALLEQSLQMWRGQALEGVPVGPALSAWAGELNESRYLAIEQLAQVRLDLGQAAEVVPLLSRHVADQPLREQAYALLMMAHYRCGNTAAAIDIFRRARHALVTQLGIEPGTALVELHKRILVRDPDLEGGIAGAGTSSRPAVTATIPRQLPPVPPILVGRDEELAALVRAGSRNDTSTIIAINGAAGTGKTALALAAAHRLADNYPDGSLYINAQASDRAEAERGPTSMADWLLRSMGLPTSELPANPVHAAALWRSIAAGRRLMILIDDVGITDDVGSLLPAAPSCLIIVTSRPVLSTLDALHFGLTPLTTTAAYHLLRVLAGPGRVDADPDAARAIARYCDNLPLALRIAAARLSRRPGYPLRRFADRLADERRRLDELEIDGWGVRTSFAISYHELCRSTDPVDLLAAGIFRLRARIDHPVDSATLAAGLGCPVDDVDAAVDRLIEMRLLEPVEGDLLHMPDLLRIFAAEQSTTTHEQSVRRTVTQRIAQFWSNAAPTAGAVVQHP